MENENLEEKTKQGIITKTIYECPICHTNYNDENTAKKCLRKGTDYIDLPSGLTLKFLRSHAWDSFLILNNTINKFHQSNFQWEVLNQLDCGLREEYPNFIEYPNDSKSLRRMFRHEGAYKLIPLSDDEFLAFYEISKSVANYSPFSQNRSNYTERYSLSYKHKELERILEQEKPIRATGIGDILSSLMIP